MQAEDVTPTNHEHVSQWLDVLMNAKEWTPADDLSTLADGTRVRRNSEQWMEIFLAPRANPYHQQGVRRTLHHSGRDSLDVFRHDYNAIGAPLIIRETVNLVLITIARPLPRWSELDEQSRRQAIASIASELILMEGEYTAQNLEKAKYRWTFRFPEKLEPGARFSTNPSLNIFRMWCWALRFDGGIDADGHLYFLGYKLREATSGKIIFPDGQHWFDGQCWSAIGARNR